MAPSLSRENEESPVLRVRTPDGTAQVLRAHFIRHNLRVLALAAGTLVASLAAWALLYFASYWVVLFTLAVSGTGRERVPQSFGLIFSTVAFCAIAYAWVDHRLTPNARLSDKKGLGELLVEFILLVPNMTLAVGGTLGAWQRLNDAELAQAAALLHRVAAEKRVPMSGVRLQIPDPAAALRVLFALQLTEVLEVRRDGNEFWLKLNALRPAALRMGRGAPPET